MTVPGDATREALRSAESGWITVLGLAFAQFLGSGGQMIMAVLSGIVGSILAPTSALATLPVATGVLGVAIATVPAATLMQRFGRRPVFILASLLAAGGGGLCALSIESGSFAGFCIGCFLMGNNMAVVTQYRFAAGESVSSDQVSRAVSSVMLGTLGAAVVAPWLALEFRGVLHADFAGSYAVLTVIYTAAGILLGFIPLPKASLRSSVSGPGRTVAQLVRQPAFFVAVASAAIGYGVMSLVMTAAPISMHVMDGHTVEDTASVIRGHVLSMFAPSLVSGWLVARLGIKRMLWTGVALETACVFLAFSGHSVWTYRLALISLGAGWNFLFVAGTTLLTRTYTADEKFRAQGFNDFVMFGTMATASLSAGALLTTVNWGWLNLATLGLLMPLSLALWWHRDALD